jgi:hypothetical protein
MDNALTCIPFKNCAEVNLPQMSASETMVNRNHALCCILLIVLFQRRRHNLCGWIIAGSHRLLSQWLVLNASVVETRGRPAQRWQTRQDRGAVLRGGA